MKRRIKRIIIFISVFVIVFSIFFYFVATNKAYDKKIFFSPQSAVKNWGLQSDEMLFEFSDENFYIGFDNNSRIKSARKDFGFWVRSKSDVFSKSDVNDIYTVTVKNTVYVYGITREKDAKEVKILDYLLDEVDTEFNGSFIDSINALCFCLKIDESDLVLGSYSVEIIDGDNKIIPETLSQDEKLVSLINQILEAPRNGTETYDDIELSNDSLALKTAGHLHLVGETDGETLQEYKEFVEFYFYDDFVLIQEKTEIFTAKNSEHAKTRTRFYSKTYKLEYTDQLRELKLYCKSN